jgi:hypothetical protein
LSPFGGGIFGDRFEDVVDANPGLRARRDRFHAIEPHDVFHLLAGAIDVRARQVHLVEDRHDLQIVFDGEVRVRQSSCLDPLGRIHDQQCLRMLARLHDTS